MFEIEVQATKKEKGRCIELINKLDSITDGKTIVKKHAEAKILEFPGNIGLMSLEYVQYLRDKGYKEITLSIYRSTLSNFSLETNGDKLELNDLTPQYVLDYVFKVQPLSRRITDVIKGFLRYEYDKGLVDYKLCSCLDNLRVNRVVKLPSVYSPDEVMMLERSVNRSSPVGKRDYAMILLASRLGLRSSDICTMRFEHINWDECTITLVQEKTNRSIILPLLEDVGEAIIDYIRCGRPNTTSKYIFVSHNNPEKHADTNLLTSRVKRYFGEAKIDTTNRHAGPHALRHSLATALMNGGIELPVISEALGHEFTSSTMHYLNVNLEALIECSLDVPSVDSKYYSQGGGRLYEKN